MVEPGNRLVGRLVTSGSTTVEQEQQRLKALSELGLLQSQTIPVFEEATQTAAKLLDAPVCIIGFIDSHRHLFKAAVGLSRLGLMNKIAQERQLPRSQSFCNYVVESRQVLAIDDTLLSPDASMVLVQQYGIRAYLGVPLIDSQGNALGTIAIMEQLPRTFTPKDIQSLEIIARWSMSEFERQFMLNSIANLKTSNLFESIASPQILSDRDLLTKSVLDRAKTKTDLANKLLLSPKKIVPQGDFVTETLDIKLELLEQLIQELRTPLTSILGMATVLSREIYGPLMNKQKEYLEIVQKSGRYLLSLVNEISELGTITSKIEDLDLATVDIEMLCQQVIHSLEDSAKRKEQQIRLSVERDRARAWVIDKEKVRQLLYHLIFSIIQSASSGSIIRTHVFSTINSQKIAISVSHPWLGDGLTDIEPIFARFASLNHAHITSDPALVERSQRTNLLPPPPENFTVLTTDSNLENKDSLSLAAEQSNDHLPTQLYSLSDLRLLLSCHLAHLHGGEISIESTPEAGYRYLLSLPNLEELKTDS